jgi:hypothetical protein
MTLVIGPIRGRLHRAIKIDSIHSSLAPQVLLGIGPHDMVLTLMRFWSAQKRCGLRRRRWSNCLQNVRSPRTLCATRCGVCSGTRFSRVSTGRIHDAAPHGGRTVIQPMEVMCERSSPAVWGRGDFSLIAGFRYCSKE